MWLWGLVQPIVYLKEQSFSLFDLFLFVCVDDNCVFDLSRGDIHIHDDAMYIVWAERRLRTAVCRCLIRDLIIRTRQHHQSASFMPQFPYNCIILYFSVERRVVALFPLFFFSNYTHFSPAYSGRAGLICCGHDKIHEERRQLQIKRRKTNSAQILGFQYVVCTTVLVGFGYYQGHVCLSCSFWSFALKAVLLALGC